MELFDRRDLFHGARAKAAVDAFAEVAPFSLVNSGITSAQLAVTPRGHSPLLGKTNTYTGCGATGLLISCRSLRVSAPSGNKALLSHWGASA